MKLCAIAILTLSTLWLACVPLPGDGGANRELWPATASGCDSDDQCAGGLVCQPLTQEVLEALLEFAGLDEIPAGAPQLVGEFVCQPGCRIDETFRSPTEADPESGGCQVCDPATSTVAWTSAAAGTACDDGLFCTSGSGVPGEADICDDAGACTGQAVNCNDGLYCTGAETCNEDADRCDSTGDPCPTTDCHACQEATDSCLAPAGTACGSSRDTACDNPDTCDAAGNCLANYEPTSRVCRSVADICDVQETCDGRGRCPDDAFAEAGTVCNEGSGDICDPDEVCTGKSAACPDDTVAVAGTVCNEGSGDMCDPDEVCSGNPDEACPDDTVAAAGTVCNEGSGDICDPEERCTGIADQACPEDTVAAAGTVCNEGSGDACDPDEVCSGNPDEACPEDTVAAAGTVCNEGSGDACDPDEVCSGVADEACPDDSFASAGTVCRVGSGDICDPDETCPGVADQRCPSDTVAASTTVCRAAAGPCDVDDYCTGVAGAACSADAKAATDVECREAAGCCDVTETCDGTNNACPTDEFAPSTQLCRGAGHTINDNCSTTFGFGGECDVSEYCPGDGPDCPENAFQPAGTVCRASGGVCDFEEVCSGNNAACPLDISSADVCRPAVDLCDEAEVCSRGPYFPDCPPDEVKPAGEVCRPAAPAAFPIVAACDIVEVCDGSSTACPPNERIPQGGVCEFNGGTGTCESTGGPLRCIVVGDTPNGGACTTDQDCQSLHCAEAPSGQLECMAEDVMGFGETCDGDGFRFGGDPNGRHCIDEGIGGDYFVCCAGSSLAAAGQTGICKECCLTDDSDLLGCDSGVVPACCSGRCKDIGTDPENCGLCGDSCYDAVNACLPSVISCGQDGPLGFTPGVCDMTFACGAGQVCQDPCTLCWFYGNCDGCETLPARCITLTVPVGTLCAECDDDSDCNGDQRCYSGCDGGWGSIFCVAPNYCAVDPDDCGN